MRGGRLRAHRYIIREVMLEIEDADYLEALHAKLTARTFPRPSMCFREFLAYCALTGAKEIEAGQKEVSRA